MELELKEQDLIREIDLNEQKYSKNLIYNF